MLDDFDGISGGATGADGLDALRELLPPFPSEAEVGCVRVPPFPHLPDLSDAETVAYLMLLYGGWSRRRFLSASAATHRGARGQSTTRTLIEAGRILRARGIRPGAWLVACEAPWRAIRDADPRARAALHPAPGWVWSPVRLARFSVPPAAPLVQTAPHPAVRGLVTRWGLARDALAALPPAERAAAAEEIRATWREHVAAAAAAVEMTNRIAEEYAARGSWVWA